jgi:uncharacterized repeat protein (TIGR04138 family)
VIPLTDILKIDTRYTVDAYLLLNDGLQLAYGQTGKKSNITAGELLEAISKVATDRYGPLAEVVLKSWGINSAADIGTLISNLVNAGLLRPDTVNPHEDFVTGFNFKADFFANCPPSARELE